MKRSKTYTPELREEAVKLVLAQGLTLEDADFRLTSPRGRWVTGWRGNAPKAALAAVPSPSWRRSSSNCAEALAALRRDPDIAILFSDVIMPGMSGVALAAAARQACPALKVILASGFPPPAVQQDTEGQIVEFLSKPYRLSDLVRTLRLFH